MPITFQNADIKFLLSQNNKLKAFITAQVMKASKKKINISYVFCSDDYLLDINKKFLKHDYYTDIITFPLSESDDLIEAEIYISIDRVKDNAQQLKADFTDELLRVVFHGILHLVGFKDKSKTDKATMRKKEDQWIAAYHKSKPI